jgi:hypothetical protein
VPATRTPRIGVESAWVWSVGLTRTPPWSAHRGGPRCAR